MLKASFAKYPLFFKKPSGTSRGILNEKESYFLKVWNTESPNIIGWGEASIISGLSWDDPSRMTEKLRWIVENIELPLDQLMSGLVDFPAIRMALEMALLDLKSNGQKIWFNSPLMKYKEPISINGLIWMGNESEMLQQIEEKIELGFACLKLKIGAIDFDSELNILSSIRKRFDEHDLEIRVDANGAFSAQEALGKLDQLSRFDLHSIEQPIRQGQWERMAELCDQTPLAIALDEELIGIHATDQMTQCLEQINPQYIILKPSLLGGFEASYQWIQAAGALSIPWWITSALESNLGLAAIAQFTSQFYNPLPQGLGTGQLYTNNINSPLVLKNDRLFYDSSIDWELPNF